MKKVILIIILLIPFLISSQTKKKEIVFLLFNKNKNEKCLIENGSGSSVKVKKFRKKIKKNKIYFNICDEDFIYTKRVSKIDTCSIKSLKKLKIVTLNYLLKKYNSTNEFKHHVFDKIYFVEKIAENKIVKYEVYWSGEWSTKN